MLSETILKELIHKLHTLIDRDLKKINKPIRDPVRRGYYVGRVEARRETCEDINNIIYSKEKIVGTK